MQITNICLSWPPRCSRSRSSRSPIRARRPVWDNPGGQCQELEFVGMEIIQEGENFVEFQDLLALPFVVSKKGSKFQRPSGPALRGYASSFSFPHLFRLS